MKNYDPKIAAIHAVRPNVQFGLSRHKYPLLAATKVTSVLTRTAHLSALKGYANWLLDSSGMHLKNSTPQDAEMYLVCRSMNVRQSTCDLDRQAIKLHLHPKDEIQFVTAEVPTMQKNRAYTSAQISLLADAAEPTLRLSILLAVDAGLRDMELLTIAMPGEQPLSDRNWHQKRFVGRQDDAPFTVLGKGGLTREIRVKRQFAEGLERLRRCQRLVVKNRDADLLSTYFLMGGNEFSRKFGRLSKSVLGFSHGSHGLRHSFAQRRRDELLCLGCSVEDAVDILSQELGHFSKKNTFAYLRD